MRTWGATDAEAAMALPGDETVPDPGFEQTRVVSIDAPASDGLAVDRADRAGPRRLLQLHVA